MAAQVKTKRERERGATEMCSMLLGANVFVDAQIAATACGHRVYCECVCTVCTVSVCVCVYIVFVCVCLCVLTIISFVVHKTFANDALHL